MRWYVKILVLLSIAIFAVGCGGSKDTSEGGSLSASSGESSSSNDIADENVNLGGGSSGGGADINTDINNSTGGGKTPSGDAGNFDNGKGDSSNSGGNVMGVEDNGLPDPHEYIIKNMVDIIKLFYDEKMNSSLSSDGSSSSNSGAGKGPTESGRDYSEISIETILMAGSDAEYPLIVGQNSKVPMSVLHSVYPDRQVYYKSSDESVVRVDTNGTLFAVSKGRATVTASFDGKNVSTVYVVG